MFYSLFTVVDICRMMRREPDDVLMWQVGSAVRDIWLKEEGREMTYQLREKKNGSGTHQYAVYPLWFVPRIMQVISAYCVERSRQGDLFDGLDGAAAP